MTEIFLEQFEVKRIEKITVLAKELRYNSCEFNESRQETGRMVGLEPSV